MITASNISLTPRNADNQFELPAGEYVIICSENVTEGFEIFELFENPREIGITNNFVAATFENENFYSLVEWVSGISNVIMTPRLLNILCESGVELETTDHPILQISENTTLGAIDLETDDETKFSNLEIGDTVINFYESLANHVTEI